MSSIVTVIFYLQETSVNVSNDPHKSEKISEKIQSCDLHPFLVENNPSSQNTDCLWPNAVWNSSYV